MFNDAIIVQSAISAFNNAALAAPAFLWSAILSVPLFLMVYYYGREFLSRIGWRDDNWARNTSLATVGMAFAWLVLFGGNYAVLRDGASLLPFVVAGIVFLSAMFIAGRVKKIPARKPVIYTGAVLIMVALGLSDTHAWWGALLQIGAGAFGWLIGRTRRVRISDTPGAILVMTVIVGAILMQPEFFRFGQLGNLGFFHMLFMLLFAAAVAATVALRNVKPSGRIHNSAYIKLKWMARFVTLLTGVLFFLTESVPVFLAAMVVLLASFAMSVWHMKSIPAGVAERMFAITLVVFGILTVMPVITAIGVCYWQYAGNNDFRSDIKALL